MKKVWKSFNVFSRLLVIAICSLHFDRFTHFHMLDDQNNHKKIIYDFSLNFLCAFFWRKDKICNVICSFCIFAFLNVLHSIRWGLET